MLNIYPIVEHQRGRNKIANVKKISSKIHIVYSIYMVSDHHTLLNTLWKSALHSTVHSNSTACTPGEALCKSGKRGLV